MIKNGEKKIITGITVAEQMSKAQAILDNVVIPRSEAYAARKKENRLKKINKK